MKRKYITVALAMLLLAGTTTSCIGSFSLTNKLLSWNKQVGSKFVNELVFFAFWIIPVYEVAGLADVMVLNSIEFWSGTNPVAQGRTIINGSDGKYLVDCDGKGYTITSLDDKSSVRLDFDSDEQTWSVTTEGNTYELMTFVDDSHVALPDGQGGSIVVELSQNGLMAYRQIATAGALAAK